MSAIGPLQFTITWYKNRHAGAQSKTKQLNLIFFCFGCPSGRFALQHGGFFLLCDRKLQRAYYKQLLDEVFAISRIIKVEVRVISKITLTGDLDYSGRYHKTK